MTIPTVSGLSIWTEIDRCSVETTTILPSIPEPSGFARNVIYIVSARATLDENENGPPGGYGRRPRATRYIVGGDGGRFSSLLE